FPRRLKLGSLPVWNLGETEYTIEDCIMVPRCKGIHKTHSMLETPSSSTALEMMRCTSPVTECSTIEDSLCATQGSTAPVTKENSPTAGCSRNEALPRTPKTSKAFRPQVFSHSVSSIMRRFSELGVKGFLPEAVGTADFLLSSTSYSIVLMELYSATTWKISENSINQEF
ncbi:hypothetical protein JTB14_007681, partial [Gonioctena quinquepunctata]